MSEIRVNIGGHVYRVAAEPGGEARMSSLAAELDATIGSLKQRLGAIGDRSLAVVAGLTVLDRLREVEAKNRALATRVDQLERARADAALAAGVEDPQVLAALGEAAEAVERVTAIITGDLHALARGGKRPVAVAEAPPAPRPRPRPDAARACSALEVKPGRRPG